MIIVEDEVMVQAVAGRIAPRVCEDRESVEVSGDRSGTLIDRHHLAVTGVSDDGALTKRLIKSISAYTLNDLRGVVVGA